MLSDVAATRVVAQRYEDALRQIACLKRQNNELKELIRGNEIKAMQLIGHFTSEIDAQTNLAAKLKGELRARDDLELLKRQRDFRDQSTWIEEDELQSKEKEMLAIIYVLEDEIQALKDDKMQQMQEFDRQALVNQANVKQSFLRDVDAFRSQISNSVCGEVRDALVDTIADNERLTREFRLLLHEMEKLQVSRDKKDDELSRTNRELEFLIHKDQLMASKMQCRSSEKRTRVQSSTQTTREGVEEVINSKRKAAVGSSLEEYFKQCIKNTQRDQSYNSIRLIRE